MLLGKDNVYCLIVQLKMWSFGMKHHYFLDDVTKNEVPACHKLFEKHSLGFEFRVVNFPRSVALLRLKSPLCPTIYQKLRIEDKDLCLFKGY